MFSPKPRNVGFKRRISFTISQRGFVRWIKKINDIWARADNQQISSLFSTTTGSRRITGKTTLSKLLWISDLISGYSFYEQTFAYYLEDIRSFWWPNLPWNCFNPRWFVHHLEGLPSLTESQFFQPLIGK